MYVLGRSSCVAPLVILKKTLDDILEAGSSFEQMYRMVGIRQDTPRPIRASC